MRKRSIKVKFASAAIATARCVNSLGTVAFANPGETPTEVETGIGTETPEGAPTAETPVAEEAPVDEEPEDVPNAQSVEGEPEETGKKNATISGDMYEAITAVIDGKEYDGFCLDKNYIIPNGEIFEEVPKDDPAYCEKYLVSKVDGKDTIEALEKVLTEAAKSPDMGLKYYAKILEESLKDENNPIEYSEEQLEEIAKNTLHESALKQLYFELSANGEEFEQFPSDIQDSDEANRVWIEYLETKIPKDSVDNKVNDTIHSYDKLFINAIIWDYMQNNGLGDNLGNDSYETLLSEYGFSEIYKKLMSAAEAEKDNFVNPGNTIVASKDKETLVTWEKEDEKFSTTDKLVFSLQKNEKDEDVFVTKDFELKIDGLEDPVISFAEDETLKDFSLVKNEDGTYKVVSSSKPTGKTLQFLADYLHKVNAEMYYTTKKVYSTQTSQMEPVQTVLVGIPENAELEFAVDTDVLADLTINKVEMVDGEMKTISDNTEFYLWYMDNADTYYIINNTEDDGDVFVSVKYDKENKDVRYTLNVSGTLNIDGYLLESIVYYLQEAKAPEGYELDPKVKIICTDEQFEELEKTEKIKNEVLGESFEVDKDRYKLDGYKSFEINVVNNKIKSDDKTDDNPQGGNPSGDKTDGNTPDDNTPGDNTPGEQPGTGTETPVEKPENTTPDNTTPGGNGGSGSSHSSSSSSRTTSTIAEAPVPEAPLQVLGAFEADEIAEEEIPLAVLPMTGHERTMLVQLLFLAGIAGIVADIVEKIRRKENN